MLTRKGSGVDMQKNAVASVQLAHERDRYLAYALLSCIYRRVCWVIQETHVHWALELVRFLN